MSRNVWLLTALTTSCALALLTASCAEWQWLSGHSAHSSFLEPQQPRCTEWRPLLPAVLHNAPAACTNRQVPRCRTCRRSSSPSPTRSTQTWQHNEAMPPPPSACATRTSSAPGSTTVCCPSCCGPWARSGWQGGHDRQSCSAGVDPWHAPPALGVTDL
jgi:hypothetical protein